MTEPFIIPEHRLPPGFAETVEQTPAEPVQPRPAATAVLLRDAEDDIETLLLRRRGTAGFVPGAYVFPGGRVDAADSEVEWPVQNVDPEARYWIAAVREVFEETGVLLARTAAGVWSTDASADAGLELWRNQLMSEEATLQDLLQTRGLFLAAREIAYIAHWITPLVEPRRYDTRFFMAAMPRGRQVRIDAREMVEAVWLSPRAALSRFEAGALPMVFPTVKTLQMLQPFRSVAEVFGAFRERSIKPIMPRLVRTAEGVGIVVDQEG